MKYKKVIFGFSISIFLVLILIFEFGPGFPFCPLILGFNEYKGERFSIFYHSKQYLDENEVIKILSENEIFHNLHFQKRIQIVLTDSNEEFYRLTLNTFRFTTFPPFGRVFVSKRNQDDWYSGKIHIYNYLKHELSHALIFQNSNIIDFCNKKLPSWFLEGIATYSSGMVGSDGYPDFSKVSEMIADGVYINPSDMQSGFLASETDSIKSLKIEGKYYFLYSEFALVIDNLINIYGKQKLLLLISEMTEGKDFYKTFEIIYGISFKDYMNEFKSNIENGKRLTTAST